MVPPTFFVETDFIYTGVYLKKAKRNPKLNYFRNSKKESTESTVLIEVGWQEAPGGSHLCLLE